MNAALIIHAPLLADPEADQVLAGLRLRKATAVALGACDRLPSVPWSGTWKLRELLAALRLVGADAAHSWLACSDPAAIAAAASAGLHGVVLVGVAHPGGDPALVVATSPNLAGVTIAMVPRGGGCWHDQR